MSWKLPSVEKRLLDKTVDVLGFQRLNLLAFDILFDKSPDTLEDSVFAESLKQSDFSILSYNFSEPDSEFFIPGYFTQTGSKFKFRRIHRFDL